jgi:hypothetical protein
MANSIIETVSHSSIEIGSIGPLEITDCDLARGDHGVVYIHDNGLPCGEIDVLNMTNNYWGTTDPDTIQSWIRDNNDSPNACYIVDYEPFETESTPVEKKSLSDLKGMFR